MSLLSSSASITRFKVEGKIEEPIVENIENALMANVFKEIDNDSTELSAGWTSINNSFKPDFKGSSFVFGTLFIFSLRIDKKSISSKIINKYYNIEMAKRLAECKQEYLSSNEKKSIKENVTNILSLRIPATPNIYDLIWNYEESSLWFFSTLKNAIENLETLFSKSFNLSLINLFPYTTADLMIGLSDSDRDVLSKSSPTKFTEQ